MFELSAIQFILSSAKFLLMISIDDGTSVFILLFVGQGFKVEADVEINKSSVSIWIFGIYIVLHALKVQNQPQIQCSSIRFSSAYFRLRIPKVRNGCHDIDISVLSFIHSESG